MNFFRNASIPFLIAAILFLLPGCSDDSLTEENNQTASPGTTSSHSDADVSANVLAASSPMPDSIRDAEVSASSPLVTDATRGAEAPASSVQEDIDANDTYVDGTVPNKEQIALWCKLKFGDELEVGEPVEVHLANNELAYLARSVDISGVMLVRPKYREVADVSDSIGTEFEIFDLDRDGVSEIVTTVPGIDQNGRKTSTRQILKLDGWDPVILHKIRIETNRGLRIKGGKLQGRDMQVNWGLTPKLANGNPAQLIEEVFINNWVLYQDREKKEDHVLKFRNTYQYINQKMAEIDSTDPRVK